MDRNHWTVYLDLLLNIKKHPPFIIYILAIVFREVKNV